MADDDATYGLASDCCIEMHDGYRGVDYKLVVFTLFWFFVIFRVDE
jgi:hypothetical protein